MTKTVLVRFINSYRPLVYKDVFSIRYGQRTRPVTHWKRLL